MSVTPTQPIPDAAPASAPPVVVSDTGPLNYLLLIGEADVLPRMFGRVFAPPAVAAELSAPAAPPPVRRWIATPPDWLAVREADAVLGPPDLHDGEREAIALALSLGAGLTLLDEKKGRAAARALGLRVLGTVGVLARAADVGLLSLPEAVGRLRSTSFQVSEALLESVLAADRARAGV